LEVILLESCSKLSHLGRRECTAALEGYLVAETVHMGRKQVIDLPSANNLNDPELEDKKII
jgi:hypothetical protein